MQISLNWLKEHINHGLSEKQLSDKLTMAGLEVERVHSVGKDKVMEVEVTPNRADWLNIIGISREISAIVNKPRKDPKLAKISYPKEKCSITIEDKQACRRYIGTIVENIKMGTSSDDVKAKLASMGTKTISNIVDITNFSLMENGQPLHAFDFDKIAGGKIIVRRAKKGEKLIAIDEVEYTLDPSILVIADEKKPIAIAGIMGGKETEVTSSTSNILLESAYFDPVLTRRASRKLGLSSDSSYRFERGVDYQGVAYGSARAINLIQGIAGGKIVAHNDVEAQKKQITTKPIVLNSSFINSYLGSSISDAQIKSILSKLDFKITKPSKDKIAIVPPSFRSDVYDKEDVVEEVARIVGYDNLPMALPELKVSDIEMDVNRGLKKILSSQLLSQGYNEVITFSMTNKEALAKCSQLTEDNVAIKNPLTLDQELMRPTMLATMLPVVKLNVNRGQKQLKIFEVGKVYHAKGEEDALGLILLADKQADWRVNDQGAHDFYDMKGAINEALGQVGVEKLNYISFSADHFKGGCAATIEYKNKDIGTIGRLSDKVLASNEIKSTVAYFAQLDLNEIFKHAARNSKFQTISEYPAITRDISMAVDRATSYQQINDAIAKVNPQHLVQVSFCELYLGEKIEKGKKGFVISLCYQSRQRTLTEDEVNSEHQKVLDALINDIHVTIR